MPCNVTNMIILINGIVVLIMCQNKEPRSQLHLPHKDTFSDAKFCTVMSPKGTIFSNTESHPAE